VKYSAGNSNGNGDDEAASAGVHRMQIFNLHISLCVQTHKKTEAYIKKIQQLRDRMRPQVWIVLAHELGREDKYRHKFLPGRL